MALVRDFFQIWIDGLKQLPGNMFYLALFSALLLSVICYITCNYYSRLWNKTYHTTLTLKILSGIVSVLTFLFVLSYISFSSLKEIAVASIDKWADGLSNNNEWTYKVLEKIYYKVKEAGIEDFTNYPVYDRQHATVPTSKTASYELAGNIYAAEACNNFDSIHPFLAKAVWAKSTIPAEAVKTDMQNKFSSSPDYKTYPAKDAISLVAKIIKNDLELQAPKVVSTARALLVLLFVMVQAIPFVLIGYAAYRDLRRTE